MRCAQVSDEESHKKTYVDLAKLFNDRVRKIAALCSAIARLAKTNGQLSCAIDDNWLLVLSERYPSGKEFRWIVESTVTVISNEIDISFF